jgi:hypothetical protein
MEVAIVPESEHVSKDSMGVEFVAEADGRKISCLISEEALGSFNIQAGLEETEPLDSFNAHKDRITELAGKMIERDYLDSEGKLLIVEADLR